tara:strand:- start:3299 stop:3952 length:654 start_codon:yes stop_codon:yes gene_type:complete
MFKDKDNIDLLWETLTENVINVNKENFDIIRYKFLNHIDVVDSVHSLSLSDKNKKFVAEFIDMYNSINANYTEPLDTLVEDRKNEFNKLMNPLKPETINLSDNISSESNIDISKKLEEFQKKRASEPWNSNYETLVAKVPEDNSNKITENFISKLKIEGEPIDRKTIKPIDIDRKVSFVDEPIDSQIKKNDILAELRDIKRKVSKIINVLETTEIVI